MIKCDFCGVESDLEQAFRKIPRSFSHKFRWICPDCWLKRAQKTFKRFSIYWLIYGVLGVVLAFVPKVQFVGFFFLNLLLLDVCLLLLILPHELGHALAAKLVGFRVFNVFVGVGKTFYKTRLLGFRLEIKRTPSGGATIAAPTNSKAVRSKYFLYVFAGPFVSVVIGWIVYVFMPHPMWPHVEFQIGYLMGLYPVLFLGAKLMPLQILFLANVFILLRNLWPRQAKTVYGPIPSDGLALLKTPFMKQERIKQLLAANLIQEAFEAFYDRKYTEAEKWARTGLNSFGVNAQLTNLLGVILLQQGRIPEGREIFVAQVYPPAADPAIYGFALNNLAYANIISEQEELLPEADNCSRLAMEKFPWHPAFKATRGAVLVRLGQLEPGMELLNEAMAKQEDDYSKGINACFLSIAERKRGNPQRADDYLKAARTFDPDCILIQKAAAAKTDAPTNP
jgi:tetratricopeptide (TPR) repeat protein